MINFCLIDLWNYNSLFVLIFEVKFIIERTSNMPRSIFNKILFRIEGLILKFGRLEATE